MIENKDVIEPWYKQPWLWFILTPLIAAVLVGSFLLYKAITTSDGIVKDDYYKVARGYAIDPSRLNRARDLNISGKLSLDNMTGDLMLVLETSEAVKPDKLKLSIVSPTHKQYDQTIILKQITDRNAYTGSLFSELKGKRYLMLEPPNGSWRLRTESNPPYGQNTIVFKPTEK